jgi:trehalose-6-phosphatase
VLRRLLRRGRPVAIASGRPLSILRAAYPIPGLDLVGSHGSEILASGGAGRSFGDRSAVVAEARPGGTAKGDVLRFLRRTSPAWRWRAVLVTGDDATDEDMFATLRPGDVGVLVARRPRASHARWRLPSTGHVVRFLEAVAAAGKEEKCR